jgi:hypothetical protein
LAHVAEVLTILRNDGLSLKRGKCHLFSETVEYLGHVIRPGRLGIAEKTTALKTAPLPRAHSELRFFLGIFNVYRRFVPLFPAFAAHLNVLLCNFMPPQLDRLPPAVADFTELRDRLLYLPVLVLPRTEGLRFLGTDPLDGQVDCFLLQVQPDGKPFPLGF